MRDFISIGPAPYDEDCVQVSIGESYLPKMRKECQRFIELLRKKFGNEPLGARLYIKSEQHDFGPYLEVVCEYDENEAESVKYAFELESQCPAKWDE